MEVFGAFSATCEPGEFGRSKNVVSSVEKRGKKRRKAEKERGKWLIGFCRNSHGPFGVS